jgi:hypothetical protein
MVPKREFTHYRFVCNKGWWNIHFSSCDTSKVRLDESVFSAYSQSEFQWYTQLPFVPRLPWLALSIGETSYGIRMGFMGPQIIFTNCLSIWSATSDLVQLIKQKSYSHNRKENNRRFPPEIITLVDMDMSNGWGVCKIWRVRSYASALS